MSLINDRDDPSSLQVEIRAKIEDALLSSTVPPDWSLVNYLLQQLTGISAKAGCCYCNYRSLEDDPMGRLLLGSLVSRNPPVATLELALAVFPDALSHNPAIFFTACQEASPQIVARMMRHCLDHQGGPGFQECPYPWILSNHITVEGAQALLEVYPAGVLQESSFLSSYSPLDYMLMSDEMVKGRTVKHAQWKKLKIMLVAAQSCLEELSKADMGICPVQTFLQRIMSRPDFLDNSKRAQHCLWLLHQLRWSDPWVFEKQHQDGMYPLHYVLSHKCTKDQSGLVAARALVQLLLEAHPHSARHCLPNGRMALHLAMENGWPCHDLLLSIFPEALSVTDPQTDFLPFQTAAEEHHNHLSLDVTFELLRADPTHAARVGAQA